MVRRPLLILGVLASAIALAACSDSGGGNTDSTAGTNSTAGAGGGTSDASTGGVSSGEAGSSATSTGGSTAASTSGNAGASGECKSETDITASTSGVAACKAFCAEEDHCKAETTAAECEAYRNCGIQDTGPAGCPEASRIWWDCMRAQPDICNIGSCCDAQAAAVTAACST